jgi:hypothetical protein
VGLTCHHPPLPTKPGNQHTWVEETGGLPKYIECRARAIFWSGSGRGSADVSKAIEISVGVTRDEAEGRRKVTPKTRAMAEAAINKWDRMRARAKASN